MANTNLDEPLKLFQQWYCEATEKEVDVPSAMSVATVDAQGHPSSRMVLLKEYDTKGFVFYTNLESRKADEIAANPQVSLLFHWKSLKRQEITSCSGTSSITRESCGAVSSNLRALNLRASNLSWLCPKIRQTVGLRQKESLYTQ